MEVDNGVLIDNDQQFVDIENVDQEHEQEILHSMFHAESEKSSVSYDEVSQAADKISHRDLGLARLRAIERLRDRRHELKLDRQRQEQEALLKSTLTRARWRQNLKEKRKNVVADAVDRSVNLTLSFYE